MEADRYVTASELDDHGLTAEDILCLCPVAQEYAALDGAPCWKREDLAPLFRHPEGGHES